MSTLPRVIQLELLAIVLVFALVLVATSRTKPSIWSTFMAWFLGGGTALWIGLSPRVHNLSTPEAQYAVGAVPDGPWSVVLRFLAAGTLLTSAIVIVLHVLSRRPLARAGRSLWIAALLLSGADVLAALFGAVPAFRYGVLLFPLALTTFYLTLPKGTALLGTIRAIFLGFLVASIAGALLNPEWAFQVNYAQGLIPGLEQRLYGLSPHPNSLGPLALLYLILEWIVPSKHRGVRAIGILCAMAVLVLAQSKTALIAAAFVTVLLTVYHASKRRRHVATGVAFVVLLLGIVAASISMPGLLDTMADSDPYGLSTLTGRTRIWQISFDTWREYPLVGYGPTVWSLDFRLTRGQGILPAGHAHNQLLQSLAQSGIVGGVALIAYLVVLVRYGAALAGKTRGGSVALVFLLIARSVTETPFRSYVIDTSFLLHVFSVAALMALDGARPLAAQEASRSMGWNGRTLQWRKRRVLTNDRMSASHVRDDPVHGGTT